MLCTSWVRCDGEIHLPVINNIRNAEIVWICDVSGLAGRFPSEKNRVGIVL